MQPSSGPGPDPSAPTEIVLVTSVIGSRDFLRDDQHAAPGGIFISFVDRRWKSATWHELPAYDDFLSPRRNSRIPKILIHQFVSARYSIWMDANVAIKVPADRLISEWLSDHDLAVFKHHCRDCVYDEAAVCARRQLDKPDKIATQMSKYERGGLPRRAGLGECSVIARRHTPEMERFNTYWWSEYCRHSVRDQLSFMYCAHRLKIRVNLITPSKLDHPYFDIINRPAEAEPFIFPALAPREIS